MTTRTPKTWDEFWGPLLFLRFHADSPERWPKRQERARWLFETLRLGPGVRILDPGCGDGLLDICLAGLGARVTAVDRLASVLRAARAEPGGDAVDFVVADLRHVAFPLAAFDVVLMFELVGLMGREDDASVIRRAGTWLAPGGRLVVDCPGDRQEEESRWQRAFDDGVLEVRVTHDAASRLQRIEPEFRTTAGETIVLHDPYDPSQPDRMGVVRYLYPKQELVALLEQGGLDVRQADHFTGNGHYLLIGRTPE